MRYGYARVSARDQNLARQIAALRQFDPSLPDDRIFTDKQSGKNFNREHYLELKAILVPGDEVLVEELDRFGRNKAEIKAELEWFKEHGVIVRVFDVPTTLMDFHGQDWIGEMVNNILIEVMGAMAEQERKKIKKRQAEGIEAMPIVNGRRVSGKTGRGFGRPAHALDERAFENLRQKQKDGIMTVDDCCRELGISRTTWYDRVRKAV
jgi:DNA invertase Pin-like site-specific DNA recombinase|nr:MAG TPA: gamma delta Resolvase, site specific recombination [Caudoviricetes sp.]